MSIRLRLRSSLANSDQQVQLSESDESDLSENTHAEEHSSDETEQERHKKLKNRLKKLGITDVDEHVKKVNLEELKNSRKTRSSVKPSDFKSNQICDLIQITARNIEMNETSKDLPPKLISTGRTFVNKEKHRTRKGRMILNNESTVSSLLMAAKSLNRKRSTDAESEDDQTTFKKKNSNYKYDQIERISSPNSLCESDADDEIMDNFSCKVPGCDSNGHLSGAFSTHSISSTCPVFHNQTAEQCVERYKKRLELMKNGGHKETPSKLRKSPIKRNLPPEKNPKWNSIMEERKAELSEISQKGDVLSMITSSRQPNLLDFAPSFDLKLFYEAQSRNAHLLHLNSAIELKSESDSEIDLSRQTGVQSIILGNRQIGVCYFSPYPDDFQNSLKLFICEFCLKCMNSSIIMQKHKSICSLRHPPGNEIYRRGNISFFEIDGNKQKEYCRNLCLLAKLFIDYKTQFFDVEPFLFYVMTESDDLGAHVVGYFSKEKHSSNNYNVSCILTLPSNQRLGYGRMLIDFSYLLTKAEGKVGSPEKPISDLGIISYRSYWKFVIMEYLSTFEGKDRCILLKDMSQKTGMNSNDIVSTLQLMGLLKYWKGTHLILLPPEVKIQFSNEVNKKRKLYGDKVIVPKYLSWTPKIWPLAK